MGSGQQKQSKQQIEYTRSQTRPSVFDYKHFILMMKKGQQTQVNEQGTSQQFLFNQFKCIIINHNNKHIEGMCVNEVCKALNRRTCYDCIIKNLHGIDGQSNQQNNCNADQLNDMIKEYKIFINQQVDILEYQLYFEQLQLTDEKNDNIAFEQFQELQKINYQIEQQKQLIDQISIQDYIQQQHQNNIGIYKYLFENYQPIQIIDNNIECYIKFKKQIKNSLNGVDKMEMENNDIEILQDLRKKKHLIIKNIISTQIYQTNGIDKKDKFIINYQTQALYERGKQISQQNQNELAIQYYDLHISQNSSDSLAYYWMGISLYNLKRYEEAIQMYDKAIQLNPQDSLAYNNKGCSLDYQKRYEEAIQMYDKAIQLNSQYSQAYKNKGISLYNLKRFEEAIQMCDKAIQFDPQNSQAYNHKGISLYNLRRNEEAIQMYDKAIQLNPQYSEAYNNKGISLYNLKRFEEAIQMYDKAIQFDPQNSQAYNHKGISLYNLNRFEEAIQMNDKALQLNPQDSLAYNNKAISLQKLERYEEAKLLLIKAKQISDYQ